VELGVGVSKKQFDKRKAIKARDEARKIEQDLRGIKDNDSRRN
jgi:tmRNA-binding protein